MNPIFPLPLLVPLALAVIGFAGFAAWRGSVGLPAGTRSLLAVLRLLGIAALLAILFNPGKWVNPVEEQARPWVILTDVSSSMAQKTEGSDTRASAAAALVRLTADRAESVGVPLRIHPFSDSVAASTSADSLPAADGKGTHLIPSISQVLQDAAAAGESLGGMIVLSDGRETLNSSPAEIDALALRARSRNTAVHTVVIGAGSPPPDLVLHQSRATLTAFPGQPLHIPFSLQSIGLDPLHAVVTLRDENAAELKSLTLDIPPGKTVAASFDLTAPSASVRWTIETPAVPNEVRQANNRAALAIRVIHSKTRVFLAEGAPYWDSKFLAQLLRQQPQMDVHSVHRLSEKRYFRIDSGTDEPSETDHPVFPATLEELSRYDLIIFGKNTDPFLTPERAEALRTYVRDRGGAVLFARGKPTTGNVPEIEPLEPVVWASASASDFRFMPTRDGEAAGLFGEALPAPDSALWTSLPTLRDGRQISQVKPFTRVLAEGMPEGTTSLSGRFPALLVRRYGQGVAGLVNGDGLWKWDFYPEARELGNCYEDFWTQLIQWMASYSEFLPGQDFSLRLPSYRGLSGVPVAAAISYRGQRPVPQPVMQVTSPSGTSSRIQPATLTDPSGRPSWRASFTPDAPGDWKLSLVDPREKAPPAPEVTFSVPLPPREIDDLSPDPEFLKSISTATGGQSVLPADFAAFLNREMVANPPASRESGAVWKPVWNHAIVALLIAALLGAEWFFRRRQGLA
ncbi:MAG: hypothetical protein ABIS50_07905 [Luteolibacter sp.]|uniref:hypothetical protein n=1 Tax=Luteolibacter sp. TaxID=1962973 RepID=UPI003267872D